MFVTEVQALSDVHGSVHSKCGQKLTTCSDVFMEDNIQTGQAVGWMFMEAFMQTVNKLHCVLDFLAWFIQMLWTS